MVVSIVANNSSLYAQRALRERNENVALTTQRLASGQRVFRADQDAAALAVGAGLRIENAALNAAKLNAGGAISALQIADGALAQMGDVLVRMQVLATQAASGNLGDAERAQINLEFQALRAEVDRLANDTEFNGTFPLRGTNAFGLLGAHNFAAAGIIGLSITDPAVVADAAYRYSYDATTEQLTLHRMDTGTTSTQIIDLTALLDNVAGVGNNLGAGQTLSLNFGGVGATLTLGPGFNRAASLQPAVVDGTGANINFTFPPNAFVPDLTSTPFAAVQGLNALPGAVYNTSTGNAALPLISNGTTVVLGGVAGLRYAVNGGPVGASGAASGNLVGAGTVVDVYTDTAGGPVRVGTLNLQNVATTGVETSTLTVGLGQGVLGADFTGMGGATVLTYMIGSGVIAGQDLLEVRIPAMTTVALGLASAETINLMAANSAIEATKAALGVLNQARAEVGAQQARLEVVASNLNIITENNEGARSVLLDADAAAEITNLATEQAMLEVGVGMLTQANRVPQLLIDMLRQA